MSGHYAIRRGSGGPRRQPLMSQSPGRHSLNTTQEDGR